MQAEVLRDAFLLVMYLLLQKWAVRCAVMLLCSDACANAQAILTFFKLYDILKLEINIKGDKL